VTNRFPDPPTLPFVFPGGAVSVFVGNVSTRKKFVSPLVFGAKIPVAEQEQPILFFSIVRKLFQQLAHPVRFEVLLSAEDFATAVRARLVHHHRGIPSDGLSELIGMPQE
jgi:hypothetical protein